MTDAAGLAELDEQYHRYGQALRRAVHDACPSWLLSEIERRVPGATSRAEVREVVASVSAQIDDSLRVLAEADVDEPLSGPLHTIRSSLGPITNLLDRLGHEPARRDPQDVELHPADRHDLGPMRFDDLSVEVHEAGIAWGAAKAFLHRARRRDDSSVDGVD